MGHCTFSPTLEQSSEASCRPPGAGTFRSDAIHPAGPITLGDLVAILPYMDPTLVLECTGTQILAGLENGVSMYPRMEGRFPQVSGKPAGWVSRA